MPEATRANAFWHACRAIGKPTFGIEEIVVAAWQADKARFGLKGSEDKYPDSNKVSAFLHGKSGPLKTGSIVRMSAGVYRTGPEPHTDYELHCRHGEKKWIDALLNLQASRWVRMRFYDKMTRKDYDEFFAKVNEGSRERLRTLSRLEIGVGPDAYFLCAVMNVLTEKFEEKGLPA